MKGLGVFILSFVVCFVFLALVAGVSKKGRSSSPVVAEQSPTETASEPPKPTTVSNERPSGIPVGSHIPRDLADSTTEDRKRIEQFNMVGVWGITHPRETEAEYLWLYQDGRVTMRKANCGKYAKGQWEYDAPFLELIDLDESRLMMTISRVPKRQAMPGDDIVLDFGQQVWMFLGRDKMDEGCY